MKQNFGGETIEKEGGEDTEIEFWEYVYSIRGSTLIF